MKKLILLLCMFPYMSYASTDNAWGVNQEKLDIYRAAHPRYNFPDTISKLIEPQSKQILEYFYKNYRFADYKYDEIAQQVWDMFIHMPIADLEKKTNDCIAKYYEFNGYGKHVTGQSKFYADFGSVASVSLLNGMKPDNVPKMLGCLK